MFDSSVTRGKPASFPVGRVIAGFSEGLQLMVPGEKRRLWIPEALAYKGAREPKGMLVFDIELIDIPTRAPADVKAPPADAKKTASGLAYKVLQQGVGGRHPRPTSEVTVHYTGWTTDGKMFDSSVVRGQPSTFALDGVIPGWTEGLQLMFEGEKTRFWIPEKLAYKGKSAPYGMLVFDVELIKIGAVAFCGRVGDAAGGALEPIRERPPHLIGHRSDPRQRRLRLAHVVARGAEPAVVVGLAADRVGGQRFLQHRRHPRGRRQRGVGAGRRRAAERLRERLDPRDDRFHLLAVRVGIEIGAAEHRRPARDDRGERLREALVERERAIAIDAARGDLRLPAAAQRAHRGHQIGRRLGHRGLRIADLRTRSADSGLSTDDSLD